MKTKTVCMIVYTNYEFDTRVRREAEALARNGFRVICLTPQNGHLKWEFSLGGVLVRELNADKYTGKSASSYIKSYIRFFWRAFEACNRLLLRGEVDIVHVHNLPNFLIYTALIPRIFGKKVILDIHDSLPETYLSKFPQSSRFLFKLLCLEERLCSLFAHKVICVNHPQRDALVGRGISAKKTLVVMNSPDPNLFTTKWRRNGNSDAEDFKIVYHGTMARRLGVDLIIQAVSLLVDKIPGLQLHLWGGGDNLEEFQQLTTDLRLQDIVLFRPAGFPPSRLAKNLANMDLGVIGNRKNVATELMLPVKLLEYVALEIPVVAPTLQTIQYYFSDKMITYYEANNVESMANQILGLYHDRKHRETQALRAQEFLQEYGWEKKEIELLNLYRSLIGREEMQG